MRFRVSVFFCSPEEFGDKRFLLKSIAYNATARSDMFTLPCSDKVCLSAA